MPGLAVFFPTVPTNLVLLAQQFVSDFMPCPAVSLLTVLPPNLNLVLMACQEVSDSMSDPATMSLLSAFTPILIMLVGLTASE